MKKINKINAFASLALLASSNVHAQSQNSDQPFQGVIGRTLAESKEWWPEPEKAPKDAPNVVWILIDDVGYGATSTFGGLIKTPTLDSLANNGLRYTNFHTCAISAPTRAALLTGRNSASVHVSGFSHNFMSAGFPGWDGKIPASAGTIAEILRDNGYNTFAVGKYGVTPDDDATDAGPFDRWPTGKGFDRFYGFLGSQTDQYRPDLVEDQVHVKPDGRHLSEQITDKAISYIDRQKKAAPDKPFFLYYAPGAVHAPHQVDKYWSDQYKGKFDKGWDAYRKEVFERQKKLGVIPANAQLPERNPNIKAWDKLTADEKIVYARFMEVYAGYLTYTDYQISRVINHLKEINQLDNTLVFVLIGDNGASKEGSLNGNIDRSIRTSNVPEEENIKYNLDKIGEIGTSAGTQTNYPLGWAQAANTPFKHWKQDANSEGGTHNPLIAFYPKGIKDKGGFRTQYSHVIDILPTTLELVGAKVPQVINGYVQELIEGTSLAYSIEPENKNVPERHTIQYHEMTSSYAIYKDGWKASFPHDRTKRILENEEKWHLYNTREDFNEQNDLAAKYPEKVKELADLFDAEAWKYNVYPLKQAWETTNYNTFNESKKVVLHKGNFFTSFTSPRFTNNSYTITANVEIPAAGAQGVIFSTGGYAGGLSFYLKDKKLVFAYNADGKLEEIVSSKAIPTGKVELKAEVTYTGEATGKGRNKSKAVSIFINGEKVGSKDLGLIGTPRNSVDGLEVGEDRGTAVSTSYKAPFAFTGNLKEVVLDLK